MASSWCFHQLLSLPRCHLRRSWAAIVVFSARTLRVKKNRLRPKPFEISLFHVEENFRQSTQKELWPRLRNRHQHRILHGNRCHILDDIDVPRHDKRFFSLKPCRLNPSSDAMVAQTRGRDTGRKSFRLVVLERGIRALLRR